MNPDLNSEPTARLLSRILKVAAVLALAAAVVLTVFVVTPRRSYLSSDETDYSTLTAQYGKPSPFSASRPAPGTSRSKAREISTALPVKQGNGNYLPDSTVYQRPAMQTIAYEDPLPVPDHLPAQ